MTQKSRISSSCLVKYDSQKTSLVVKGDDIKSRPVFVGGQIAHPQFCNELAIYTEQWSSCYTRFYTHSYGFPFAPYFQNVVVNYKNILKLL